ncbi:MAG: NUDIX hydrolase [uncultured bacterium]|nr:MAG: NUDIX hydrolase [uncultured bacterium]
MKIEKPKLQQPIPDNAKKVFEGVIFDVYQWQQEMFDGSFATFEKLKRSDTANILAFTEDGKVIVLQQEQPHKGKFFSIPGGRVEEGETPEEGARREFLEETGFEAESFELWHSSQLVSKMDWMHYTFVAKGCRKVAEQNLDAGERIIVSLVEMEEFLEMIITQKIKGSEFIMKFLKEDLLVIDKEKTFKKIKEYFN